MTTTVPDASAMPSFILAFLLAFAAVYIVLILFVLILAAATYVLEAIGLSGVAKGLNLKRPWLAWIPFASDWLLGTITEHAVERKTGVKGRYTKWLLISLGVFLGVYVLTLGSAIPMYALMIFTPRIDLVLIMLLVFLLLTLLLSLADIFYCLMAYLCYYRVFELCYPNQAVLFLILSIFVSYALPVFLFLCRNKVPPLEDDDTIFEECADA